MTLYSKNGSIPKPTKDNTPGWIEVPEPPVPPKGMEVVWWYPPGWVVREPEPAQINGYVWKWSQSEEMWVSYPDPVNPPAPSPTPPPPSPNGTLPVVTRITGNVSL